MQTIDNICVSVAIILKYSFSATDFNFLIISGQTGQPVGTFITGDQELTKNEHFDIKYGYASFLTILLDTTTPKNNVRRLKIIFKKLIVNKLVTDILF